MTQQLGKRLHDVRRTQQRSLKSVAEAAGISAAYLQKLERGDVKSPSPHVLHGLSVALRVSYAALMEHAGFVVPGTADASTSGRGTRGRDPTLQRVDDAVAEVRKEYPDLPGLLETYRDRRRQYAALRPGWTSGREAQDATSAAQPRYRV
jgi:transcriptional regulator with XRE-family HTH domain